MIQVEHRWYCGDGAPPTATLPNSVASCEQSFTVPFVNCNNLFQPVEGEIDGWSGSDQLLSMFRQLPIVARASPADGVREVAHPRVGREPTPGCQRTGRTPSKRPRGCAVRRLAVCPGCFFEFFGGRRGDSQGACSQPGDTSSIADEQRPARPRTSRWRLATFTSWRVLSGLDPDYQPIGLAPGAGSKAVSVVHTHGQRGGIAFVFAPRGHDPIDLLTADGRTLRVTTGDQDCAWFLFDTHLHGRSTLDYCSLQPFAQVGKVFVCFGPAGAKGVLSINGAELPVEVPTGKTPVIEELENTTVVVCSEAMITRRTRPTRRCSSASSASTPTTSRCTTPSSARTSASAPTARWTRAARARAATPLERRTRRLVERRPDEIPRGRERAVRDDRGSSRRCTTWARVRLRLAALRFTSKSASKVRAGMFDLSDRAHAYLDGQFVEVAGDGAGASGRVVGLPLKKRKHTLTLLVDNMGRVDGGSHMHRRKGLVGEIVQAADVKPGKATIEQGEPLAPLSWRSPLMGLRTGVRTHPDRVTWSFQLCASLRCSWSAAACPAPALVLVNNTIVDFVDAGERARRAWRHERRNAFKAGKNTVQLAIIADPVAGGREPAEILSELDKATSFYEGEEV